MKKPIIYLRYIDDIFGIWPHGMEDLNNFHELANNIHPNIKLTLRVSEKQLEFLDVSVLLSSNN